MSRQVADPPGSDARNAPSSISRRSWRVAFALLRWLVAAEVALRLLTHTPLGKRNLLANQLTGAQSPFVFDATLGWRPQPGHFHGLEGAGNEVTIDDSGLRANGPTGQELPAHPLILAAGGSFTFGDRVSDQDSWPAALSALTGVNTGNGGVSGYGLDQSYLRARQLMPKLHPDALILSFVVDGINRSQYSRYAGASKPCFEWKENALVLRPPPPPLSEYPSLYRVAAGNSVLANLIMTYMPPFNRWGPYGQLHDQGAQVACGIFAELGRVERTERTPIVLVLQDMGDWRTRSRDRELLETARACIRREGLDFVDAQAEFDRVRTENPKLYAGFFDDHMTRDGNRYLAEIIAKHLAEKGILHDQRTAATQ